MDASDGVSERLGDIEGELERLRTGAQAIEQAGKVASDAATIMERTLKLADTLQGENRQLAQSLATDSRQLAESLRAYGAELAQHSTQLAQTLTNESRELALSLRKTAAANRRLLWAAIVLGLANGALTLAALLTLLAA